MAQIILIETNEDLRKVFSLNLTTYLGADIILRQNAADALALLSILPEVGLIIAKSKINQEETANLIHNYLSTNGLATPMIVLGECPSLGEKVMCLQEPIKWETLIDQAASHLGITIRDSGITMKVDFVPISLIFFYDIQKTPCDIYIRIKKDSKHFQFVKRIKSNEVFDKNTIKRYEDQGLKEFYIFRDHLQYFSTFVINKLVEKLERTDLDLEYRILTTSTAHTFLRESILIMELDQAFMDLADASINSMIQTVKRSPEITKILKLLFINKISYAYQHCHLLALMCHYILLRQSWYKQEHLHILSFASFFADITLTTQQQIQISNMKELTVLNLSDEEKRTIIYHASDATKVLDFPSDYSELIKTVILQSHGSLDGIGFEDNPPEDINTLSKVFIISDCFVKILLNPNLPSNKKDILPLLFARFTNPSYQKIIKALEHKFQ